MVMTVGLKSKSLLGAVRGALQKLTQKDVLVGIPAEKATREKSKDINNAELLYIHTHGVRTPAMRQEMQQHMDKGMTYSKAHQLYLREHGSPAMAIPPRPVLEPSIQANKEAIGKWLGKAGKAALEGNAEKYMYNLEGAGNLAEKGARLWFKDPRNNWAPNSPRTIKRKGSDKPLIDTDEMHKKIVYVIRDKK